MSHEGRIYIGGQMVYKQCISLNGKLVVQATFTLPKTLWVDTIHLVGDFNVWNSSSHPLHRNRNGEWTITLNLEPGRDYQFRYLCDGQLWRTEFPAEAYVSAPDGIDNFVVRTKTQRQL